MTFEILLLLAITVCFLIAFIYSSFIAFNNWRKSSLIQAKIIGYKWCKLPARKYIMEHPVTGFWPIVMYESNNKTIQTSIKNISILIPNNKRIKIRLFNEDKHLSMNYLFYIFVIGLVLFGVIHMIMPIIFILPICIIWLVGIIFIYINDHYKNFGVFHSSIIPIHPKKPNNYENLTEDDFKRIEENDLVSYEEAMAHYYHRNKQSEKWLYPLIAIVVIIIIAYKYFW